MSKGRLLMISTDRKIFQEGSAVRARQAEYAKEWEEVHIIVFQTRNPKSEILNPKQIQNQKSETNIAPNCWAYSTRSRLKILYPFDAIKLGRFIIEKRGITEITCQDSSLTAMAGVSLKKQFGIPLEIQVHTDIGSPYFAYTFGNRVRKSMSLSYLPNADKIRVVSSRIKEYIVRTLGVDPEKIFVKPIVVDVERIKNAPVVEGADLHKKYPQFEKIVLMASRLEKEKNVGLAIRAWAEVVKKIPKAGLVIVGSGSEAERLKGESVKLGLASTRPSPDKDSVVFEAWADQTTLFSYYKTADLFLNTSLFEGYGMTLVEAQAAGCKMVSTDVGVAREVGAEIIPFDDVNKVAEAVCAVLKL